MQLCTRAEDGRPAALLYKAPIGQTHDGVGVAHGEWAGRAVVAGRHVEHAVPRLVDEQPAVERTTAGLGGVGCQCTAAIAVAGSSTWSAKYRIIQPAAGPGGVSAR